jgi:asparagine synthase (glutamine-hydrolysing)
MILSHKFHTRRLNILYNTYNPITSLVLQDIFRHNYPMSAFALIFNRDGSQPVAPEYLRAMLARLAHRGPDGRDTWLAGNFGLGFMHFQVTPEDVGTSQPVTDLSDRIHLMFDGRLDNRDEVLTTLGIGKAESHALPDTEIVLRAYLRFGDAAFSKLIGPMAAVIVDTVEQRVTLVRDSLGCRSLYYYLDHQVLVVASEPHAVMAHPAVSETLNERTLVRWCAVMAPQMGSTFYTDVSEMLPAHVLEVSADRVHQWRHWTPDPEKRLNYRSEDEYAEHFRELLTHSVRACLRSTTPVAVSMSGGYDSTSVAALAAIELAARPTPERLLTFSWRFDDLPECDETPFIDIMNQHFNMKATSIRGDDAWPLRDWETWPHTPNHPDGSPYRLLKMRLYQAVADAGARVLLTGGYGDQLLSSGQYWLAEMIRNRKYIVALRNLPPYIRRIGIRRTLTSRNLFNIVSWLLDTIPSGRRIQPNKKPVLPQWLTPSAQNMLAEELPDTWPPLASHPTRSDHYESMFGSYTTTGGVLEIFSGSQKNIEFRAPYQNQQLVEFAMALPAYMVYNGQRSKYIVYKAMDGILPESVRHAQSRGSLGSLYRRGLLDKECAIVEKLLNGHDTIWRRYVHPAALSQAMERLHVAGDGSFLLVPWLCTSLEKWRMQLYSPLMSAAI